MVDKDEIEELLSYYCSLDRDDYVIRSDGTVDVHEDVVVTRLPSDRKIPVQFGTVGGDFSINTGIQPLSLKGSPRTVGGVFHIRNNNRITDLSGGPDHVGHNYVVGNGNHITSLKGIASYVNQGLVIHDASLISLEHLPHTLKLLYVEYNKHLPVLRSVLVKQAYFSNAELGLQKIVDKYQGQGKSAMLNFALELKQAGYGSNAKW